MLLKFKMTLKTLNGLRCFAIDTYIYIHINEYEFKKDVENTPS